MDREKYVIKQTSLFSENRPGRLAAIAHAMEEEGVNIFAFSIAEADGFGVVRALVDHTEKAYRKLTSMGFIVTFTDVIAVKMRDEPRGLYEIASILGESTINIDYAYAYSGKDAAILILRVDNVNNGVKILLERGVTLMENTFFK